MAIGVFGNLHGSNQVGGGTGLGGVKIEEPQLTLIFPTKRAPKKDCKPGIRPGPLPIGPIGEPINRGPKWVLLYN